MPAYPNFYIAGPNKNFIGSSGFNANGTPITTPPGATAATATSGAGDYPVMSPDGSGLLVHKNGSPFSGVNPYNNKTYANGREVTPPPGQQFIPGTTTPVNPNDPNQVLKPFALPKNPDVTSGANDLLDQFKKTAASSLQDFGKYLGDFKNQLSSAVTAGKTATDIGPYTQQLQDTQNRYSGALDTSLAGAAQANTDATAREAAIQAQARGELGGYDTAQNNAEQAQLGRLTTQINRYKLAGGTPTSLGSDELSMLASGARDISVPIELAKANKRFDLTQNLDAPMAQNQAQRATQFWQSFQPGVAGSRYSSGSQVINLVQQAKEKAAAGDFSNAAQLLTMAGAPAEMIQKLAAGDTSVLAALNQLLSQSQNQGVQNILGVTPSQPQGYPMPGGGLPQSRYPVPNAPITYGGMPSTVGTGTGGLAYNGGGAVDANAWANYTAQQNKTVVPYSRYGGAITPGAGAPVGGYRGYDANGWPIGVGDMGQYANDPAAVASGDMGDYGASGSYGF